MIQVTYNLEREDLICSICYDTVSTPLIQCQNANHFVCFGCIIKCNRNCPQCRTSKVFHNKQLEKHIKDQMVNCSNEACPKLLFDWAVQEHRATAKMSGVQHTGVQELQRPVNTRSKQEANLSWSHPLPNTKPLTRSVNTLPHPTVARKRPAALTAKDSIIRNFESNVLKNRLIRQLPRPISENATSASQSTSISRSISLSKDKVFVLPAAAKFNLAKKKITPKIRSRISKVIPKQTGPNSKVTNSKSTVTILY